MLNRIFPATLLAAGLMALPFASVATASEFNQSTTVTFSQPVEIPGQVLPAGSYVFRVPNRLDLHNLVQVWNAKETHLIAILPTVPEERQQPTGKTVMQLQERNKNAPMAVGNWFYPGRLLGHEFIYNNNAKG